MQIVPVLQIWRCPTDLQLHVTVNWLLNCTLCNGTSSCIDLIFTSDTNFSELVMDLFKIWFWIKLMDWTTFLLEWLMIEWLNFGNLLCFFWSSLILVITRNRSFFRRPRKVMQLQHIKKIKRKFQWKLLTNQWTHASIL